MSTQLRKERYLFWGLINMVIAMFVGVMALMSWMTHNELNWGFIATVFCVAYTATMAMTCPIYQGQIELNKSNRYAQRIAELESYCKAYQAHIERLTVAKNIKEYLEQTP